MTACQLIARQSVGNNESIARARNITAEIYGPLIPAAVGMAVYANGTLVYNSTSQPQSPLALHSSKAFVYTYGKTGAAKEPIGPVEIEVRAWWP